MKKLFCLLFIITVFILSGCALEPEQKTTDTLDAAKTRGKFIVGVSFDSKPFGYINSKGEPDGFDIDIAKYIAKSLLGDEKAIQFVETKGYNSISMVAAGQVDFLIAATTITPQRQLTVAFSEPYYTTGQAVLVPPNSKIVKPKDLNNKKVIVQLNSTAEKTPRKFAPSVILLGFKSHQLAFDEFKKGKGDAIISDEALLRGFIMDNPTYKILPFKLTIEPYGIVMKNTSESASLQTAINTLLQQMRTDGTLEKLKNKWKI